LAGRRKGKGGEWRWFFGFGLKTKISWVIILQHEHRKKVIRNNNVMTGYMARSLHIIYLES
jgi:hypothetical protein